MSAGACFWWLLLIVTVPWNIHFEAKEVLAEAAESKQKGVVRQGSVGSVGRVGRRPKVGGIIVGCILIGKCLDAVLTFWSKKLNNSHFFRDKNALNLYI